MPHANQVFLSYSPSQREFVEALALRLRGDARLAFWFDEWHSVPGQPIQEQMEAALLRAQACAVILGPEPLAGWQNEQMRVAIQTRVEDAAHYRVIPVTPPGSPPPYKRQLPAFLRRHEPVVFRGADDEQAFKRLLAGILGIPPIEVEGYVQSRQAGARHPPPPPGGFVQGHALVVGIARYPHAPPLPALVLDDARAVGALLTDPARCGYPPANVVQLLDAAATGAAIRQALAGLAARTGPGDTAVVFFSGHGAYTPGSAARQFILPYEGDFARLPETALPGDELTALLRQIPAGRLLVLFDSCHSGGAGDPKGPPPELASGLAESYYAGLAQGAGRVVIASSRPGEFSWVLPGMANSLFTHYLLEALRGQAQTLADGYVRVFDVFRHVARQVPQRAAQHPIFKAAEMEADFAVALAGE